MPKTRAKKEALLGDLKERLVGVKSVVIADQTGLTMPENNELRKLCKDEGVMFLSVKKSLLKKAFADQSLSTDGISLGGSLVLAFSREDEVAPARIVHKFAKTHEKVQFRGGMLEGSLVGVEKVMALALLPSKQELYAKIVGSINAPVSGFVNVLAGTMRGLVNVLNAVKGSK